MDTEQTNLSIERVLGVLRRRVGWILLCFVLVAAAAYGFSKHQTKKYTATASLVFNNNQTSQQVAGLQALSNGGSQQAPAEHEPQARPARRHGGKDRDPARGRQGRDARRAQSDRGEGQSGSERQRAGGIEHRQRLRNSNIPGARGSNREQLHGRVRLRAAEQQPRLLRLGAEARRKAAAGAGKGKTQAGPEGGDNRPRRCRSCSPGSRPVAGGPRRTEATAPSKSRRPRRYRRRRRRRRYRGTRFSAGCLGLLLGLGVAFLLERFDRRIREPKDLEALYGLPLLGVVPESKALSRSARGGGGARGRFCRRARPSPSS